MGRIIKCHKENLLKLFFLSAIIPSFQRDISANVKDDFFGGTWIVIDLWLILNCDSLTIDNWYNIGSFIRECENCKNYLTVLNFGDIFSLLVLVEVETSIDGNKTPISIHLKANTVFPIQMNARSEFKEQLQRIRNIQNNISVEKTVEQLKFSA